MRRSISHHSVKRIPQRTCVACRKVKAKRELIRLVCVSDGSVEVDSGGKKAGRGTYLCPARRCWEIGLKGGQLERSLRTKINQDDRERLLEFARDFLEEEAGG